MPNPMRQSCRGMVEQHSDFARVCLFRGNLFDRSSGLRRTALGSRGNVRSVEMFLPSGSSSGKGTMVGNHGITLLIDCLSMAATVSVAYDENGRCEFLGEQTPFANERLMKSWSVLVIFMFCIAMFAGIMPGCSGGCVQTMQKLKRLRPL